MATGKPISDTERRSRPFKHLILYGIKMMVRRDIGGTDSIENHAQQVAAKLRGKTALEAGHMMADLLSKQKKGITDRQRRTVEEIERREDAVLTAAFAVRTAGIPLDPLCQKLVDVALELHFGENNIPPVEEPIESFVLR